MKQEDVWALQLAYFFLDKYDYRLISTGTNAVKNELWVANPHAKYSVIRISTLATSTNFFDRERIMKTKKAISDLVNVDGMLLSLHITNEVTDSSNKDMTEVCISDNYISTDILNEDFPQLKTLLQPIEDPQKEFALITKAINLIQLKGFQKSKNWVKKDISATYIMMAICVVVYLISLWLTNISGDSIVSAILTGALYKTFVYGNFEYWRLLTSGFVHVDIMHLLVNMYAFYTMGPMVERLYGKKKYVIALLGSIVVGSLFVLVGDTNTVTLGISGGLFGLLGMLLIYAIETKSIRDRRVFFNFMQILMINLLISLLPGISLLGHLGGLVAGLFFGLIFSKRVDWNMLRKNSIFAFVVLLVCLGYLGINDTNKGPLYIATDYAVVNTLDDLNLSWYGNITVNNLNNYYLTMEE